MPAPRPGGIVVLGRTFPSATTTGVPPGTLLSPYTGPCLIQTPDVVIHAKEVRCDLRILARGVTITDSRIEGSVYADYVDDIGSFTITDSTVDAGQVVRTGIGDAHFTATRVEVVGGNRSINCYSDCTVRHSYVHGQLHDASGTHHESGIRVNHESTVIGSTIACDAPDVPPDAGCSAALTGYPDFDPMHDVTIDGNLIRAGSGGYCAYGGGTEGKAFSGHTRDMRFTDNVWERGTEPGQDGGFVCGYWGPIASFDADAPGAVWRGNVYDDGTPVTP
ncbi:hypothetical protein [Agrococcus carbonis]|nr:hypothetical protein [Agrococcus carbonis]